MCVIMHLLSTVQARTHAFRMHLLLQPSHSLTCITMPRRLPLPCVTSPAWSISTARLTSPADSTSRWRSACAMLAKRAWQLAFNTSLQKILVVTEQGWIFPFWARDPWGWIWPQMSIHFGASADKFVCLIYPVREPGRNTTRSQVEPQNTT